MSNKKAEKYLTQGLENATLAMFCSALAVSAISRPQSYDRLTRWFLIAVEGVCASIMALGAAANFISYYAEKHWKNQLESTQEPDLTQKRQREHRKSRSHAHARMKKATKKPTKQRRVSSVKKQDDKGRILPIVKTSYKQSSVMANHVLNQRRRGCRGR